MTFERLWVLLFLPVPIAWMLWEWRRHVRRAPLVMKTLMVVLGLLALSEPVLETRDRKVAPPAQHIPPCGILRADVRAARADAGRRPWKDATDAAALQDLP